MKIIDMETILICGLMALVASLGIVMGIVVFMGVAISECSPAILSGSYFATSGLLWGILLLSNLKYFEKNSKYSSKS